MSRLLVRDWARSLHHDRLSVVLGDEPREKNRIRTYKGLVSPECRAAAVSFDQVELELKVRTSALFNRIEIDSKAPPRCLITLGDTFKAFGVYDWPKLAPSSMLSRISSCYTERRNLWRWELSRLLPVVCTGSSSLFFFQGVANEAILQMIGYLPIGNLQDHLELGKIRFGAELSIASV